MKWVFRLGILAIIAAVCLVLLAAFQIIRTENGYHLVRKKNFEVGAPVVDVREWGMTDWLKNKDLRETVTRIKLEEMGDKVSKSWASFSKKTEKWLKEAGGKTESKRLSKDLRDLQESAEKRFKKLADDLEQGKIDEGRFKKSMDDLEDWFKKQVDKLTD